MPHGAGWLSFKPHHVTLADCTGSNHYSAGTTAGELPRGTDVKSVVPNERPQHVGIVGEVILTESRHHASRIGQGHADPRRIADRKCATDPTVLDGPGIVSANDHVHAEPPLVEAALRLKPAQFPESGRRQHGHGEQVERTNQQERGT